MSLKKKLAVRASAIHGKGLFAQHRIPAGTVLGRCKVTESRAPTLYTLWLDEDRVVDVSCKFRYINHAKHPNVVYYDDLTVVTLAMVQAGEELLHDYGEDWE